MCIRERRNPFEVTLERFHRAIQQLGLCSADDQYRTSVTEDHCAHPPLAIGGSKNLPL